MTAAAYRVTIDTADDGTYATDISAYAMDLEWSLGFSAPWEPVAAVGTCRLELDNRDRRFSPDNTGSPYYDADTQTTLRPRRGLRIEMSTDGGASYATMWIGVIDALRPEPGTRRSRRATLQGSDNMTFLNAEQVSVSFQSNKRSDQVIDAILREYQRSYWLLGVAGRSELGRYTILGGAAFTTSLEVGQETFTYAGDSWFSENVTAASAIQDTANSEGMGRFYFTRAGVARFWDRSWQQKQMAVAAVIDADSEAAALDYAWGNVNDIYNRIIIHMTPRVAGTPNTVLWQHQGGAILVSAGGFREVNCPFVDDATGKRVGAASVTTPAAGTDYTINTRPDGKGYDYTYHPCITVTLDVKGDRATMTWKNTATGPLYLTMLQLRGTPLKHFDPEEIQVSDGVSRARYGRRDLTINAPLLNDVNAGFSIARYMLRLRADPRGHARLQLRNVDATVLGHIKDRTVGDVVRVSEAQTGVADVDYYIVGERHRVSRQGKLHECTWTLEPKAPFQSWLLSDATYGKLGQTTVLGV